MSEIIGYPLEHLAVVTICGKDAIKFLQGQCTQNVLQLTPGVAVPAAFCNAKGRTVSNVWLTQTTQKEPTIQLICHISSAAVITAHLNKYIAFFRGTTLENNARRFHGIGLTGANIEPFVASLTSEQQAHFYCQFPDGRWMIWLDAVDDSYETVLSDVEKLTIKTSNEWQAADIEQKILWLEGSQSENWIPQNFSLDLIGGISFNKGCYTGQEVVARLHFKGISKKQLFALKWSGDIEFNDNKVFDEQNVVGDILQQVTIENETLALAILKTERAQGKLYADEKQQVEIQLLN